jgi:hypothetical protein
VFFRSSYMGGKNMFNQKYWKEGELSIKRIELVQHIEEEAAAELPANATNEVNKHVCEYCK